MRAGRAGSVLALLAVVALLAIPAGLVSDVRGATYPTLTGQVTGPTTIGTSLNYTYRVTATGGPAFGFNGTQVGILSFSTTVVGVNTTGVQFLPTAGVFVNGSTNLTLETSNLTQTLTLNIEIKSGYGTDNVSTNLTYVVTVIQPYTITATIVVDSSIGTQPFSLTVLLDGTPVGTVRIPSLTSHSTYLISFRYVNPSLPAGSHTFSISLAQEHGLVVFAGGQTTYSSTFYVTSPPGNYTFYYVLGASAFVVVIFIWLTSVGARRRGRKR
jgi:hypothetical protein